MDENKENISTSLYNQLELDFNDFIYYSSSLEKDLELLKLQFVSSMPENEDLKSSQSTQTENTIKEYEELKQIVSSNELLIQNLRREKEILKRIIEDKKSNGFEEFGISDIEEMSSNLERNIKRNKIEFGNRVNITLFVNEPKENFESPFMDVLNHK